MNLNVDTTRDENSLPLSIMEKIKFIHELESLKNFFFEEVAERRKNILSSF